MALVFMGICWLVAMHCMMKEMNCIHKRINQTLDKIEFIEDIIREMGKADLPIEKALRF